MQKKYNRSKSEALVGYNRVQIGCVIVEYDLFKTTILIQNLIYI